MTLYAIFAPTGTGKSAVAEALADLTGAQLINADAFQVYKGLDIGTNKPADRARYALLDLVEPTEEFGLGSYCRYCEAALVDAHAQGRDAILVGGTGLYVRAMTERYSDMHEAPPPELREELLRREAEKGLGELVEELRTLAPDVAEEVDLQNPVRVRRALERMRTKPIPPPLQPYEQVVKVGWLPDESTFDADLADRFDLMIAAGWIEEVRALWDQKLPPSAPGLRAIGYADLLLHVEGLADFASTRERILTATRQYAKRQRTWLHREPNLRVLSVDRKQSQWECITAEGIKAVAQSSQG